MNRQDSKINTILKKTGFYDILHILILLLSILLVVYISIDTFHNQDFYKEPKFMKAQFWICVLFLLDFFIEFFLAENKWTYLRSHFIFFLVSIPYNSIISHYGWTFDPQITYCLRYIPLIRGGYAMSIVVSWFTYNKATGLFISYLATLVFTVYFASLAFFLFEHGPNPLVKTYDDALWWAAMDATTVGSNIVAVTTVGRVLSVVLAAVGMMMFPIFTVYVTNILTKKNEEGSQYNKITDTVIPSYDSSSPSSQTPPESGSSTSSTSDSSANSSKSISN